ncbi:hypothetical protein Pla108_26180 [Botrimarina colliarenosi]|uniref:Uncharacterized protein n=1 Tax=Botrimarina colliarenosi TaxID=2528001 RepID=A0A5C6AA06_9BACT|nr:hypothetical protein [Botrimarina colliarenosi]TWT96844.1 hypothetical protein Pla108_26180 [Botrimarina colliarenosi]
MSVPETLLLAIAVLVAVRTLVSLMRRRAHQLTTEVQKQIDAQREREAEAKLKARRRGSH